MRAYFWPSLLCVPLLALAGETAFCAESAQKARVPATEQRNWIYLAPGARPAYVGIQGGTATVSLNVSPDGSVIAFTGASGNDFTRILHKEPPAAIPIPDAHGVVAAALPENPPQGPGLQMLLPVGLDSRTEAVLATAHAEERKTAAPQFKPLKLGDYRRVLRKAGKV